MSERGIWEKAIYPKYEHGQLRSKWDYAGIAGALLMNAEEEKK